MAILLPYLVAIEKEKKMNHSPSYPSAKEKGLTMATLPRYYEGQVVWEWEPQFYPCEGGREGGHGHTPPLPRPF